MTGESDVVLRPMCQEDLAQIAHWERELFGCEAWSSDLLRVEWEATQGARADRCYLVAVAPGEGPNDRANSGAQVLGYVGLWYGDGRGDADVLTIATVPQQRRCGIATRLLTAVCQRAQDEGCRAILLEVRASNEPAQRLYAAHGFRPIGQRRHYYAAPMEDALVMRRSLTSDAPGPVGCESFSA